MVILGGGLLLMSEVHTPVVQDEPASRRWGHCSAEREYFADNLLVRIHLIIEMLC